MQFLELALNRLSIAIARAMMLPLSINFYGLMDYLPALNALTLRIYTLMAYIIDE